VFAEPALLLFVQSRSGRRDYYGACLPERSGSMFADVLAAIGSERAGLRINVESF
jgi:hypothetical protein